MISVVRRITRHFSLQTVLLANLSALSAIRYLRKDVKGEVAAGQKKQHLTALSGT